MLRWIPCELHTHTKNSDGNMTLVELARKAKETELECIALTDHNTISGQLDIPSVMREIGINIVPGMEWTTFHGHMVAMGITKYVDWRTIGISDIQQGIKEIHNAGGLAGVAHPYRMGSPMCTGCHWEFQIKDWQEVDYIEAWSEEFPSINPVNKRAYELWTSLLNEGYTLTAVSGRDWHSISDGNKPIAVTYLGIDTESCESFDKAVMTAIASGRAVSTMGPLINLHGKVNNNKYESGEMIEINQKINTADFIVNIDFSTRKKQWKVDSYPLRIVLMSNLGKLKEVPVDSRVSTLLHTLKVDKVKWVRAELYGRMLGKECMIAFTNPIYFSR